MTDPDTLFGRLGNRMFQMAYIMAQVKKGEIPSIYVQDEKYFAPVKDEIKQLFGEGISVTNKVSVHIRRGDFLDPKKNGFHTNLCETDYYERALQQFPIATFLVFSDDMQFAQAYFSRQQFRNYSFEFYDYEEPVEALNDMASCVSHILANSTFSWWAAYLGQHKSPGKTICPKEETWYGDGVVRTKVLSSWIQI